MDFFSARITFTDLSRLERLALALSLPGVSSKAPHRLRAGKWRTGFVRKRS